MKYTKGYKYRVEEGLAYKLQIDYGLTQDAVTPWFTITADNWLLVMPGYASDGATCFPDFDWIKTPAIAVHDPLCQAIELGILPESMNDQIDRELQLAILAQPYGGLKHRLAKLRGWYVRKATNLADSKHGSTKKVHELPRLVGEYTLAEYQEITRG